MISVTVLTGLALYRVVEPMTLTEQLAHLRQLAITDPDTSVLDQDLINTLAELAEALQEVRDGDPWRRAGAV